MTLDQAMQAQVLGRTVLYRPYPGARPERGIVKSVSKSYVFVTYEGRLHSQATRPEDLEVEVP